MIDKFLLHIYQHTYYQSLIQSLNERKLYYILPLQLFGTSSDNTQTVTLNTYDTKYVFQFANAIVQQLNMNPSKGVQVLVNGKPTLITSEFELKRGDTISFWKQQVANPNYIFFELLLLFSLSSNRGVIQYSLQIKQR